MKPSVTHRLVLLFAAAAFCLPLAQAQQIAFTWDDLPAHSTLPEGETRVGIGKKLIAAMKAEHMPPVYGFVNGGYAEREPLSLPMLKEWRDAGLPLGNHAWSHMKLNDHTVEEWQADVLKNEPLLKQLMGDRDWKWLRYPNLAEGDTAEKRIAARKFLAAHGYRIAPVTMSFSDWMFNEPYARCVAKHNDAAVAQIESAYMTAAEETIDHSRSMSKTLFGRDIPYVLLMHVGGLDAKLLPRLLKMYREKGFTFVSLEDAVKDPFYKNDLDLTLPAVPDTLEEAMHARGLAIPKHPQPRVDLNTLCN